MKQQIRLLFILGGAMLLTMGCRSLFSSETSIVESQWKNYTDVETAFGKVIPYQTGTNDLKALGFDPYRSANIRILTYVDILQLFLPNQSVQLKDLPQAVQDCVAARENGCAYLVDLQTLNSHRYGNLVVDIFGFRRKTHEDGWQFKGLILMKNGVVVYKLASGEPHISRNAKKVRPLGPLQEMDASAVQLISVPK